MRCKKKDIIDSFIGGNGSFEGRLSFTGTVRIDGEFKGEINATGHLVVGTDGRITGDVNAGSVVCSGEIRGNVVVEEYAEFRVPAKAYCELTAPRVVIEEGVVFDVDPDFRGTEEWYEQVARSRPPKDQPWYHVLPHDATHTTYVAERHLEPDESGEPVRHPLLDELFDAFRGGRYVREGALN